MNGFTGSVPPELQELPAIKDRYSFVYLERCTVSVQDSAVKAEDKDGYVLIPAHAFLILMLGPGVSLTHKAVKCLGESGTMIIWCGEASAKYYGYGKPLSQSSALLINQARIVSLPKLHMEAVKKLYGWRYPDENLTGLTLQQLRGKEGSRMRKAYRQAAQQFNVPWQGRKYDVHDDSQTSPVNRALSIANACLYGLTTSVICGLGLTPGLGLIHTGHSLSLVYDIADLYKAEITIPLCFRLASESPDNIEKRVRAELRETFRASKLIERMTQALLELFGCEDEERRPDTERTLTLWDGQRGSVESGIQYHSRNE